MKYIILVCLCILLIGCNQIQTTNDYDFEEDYLSRLPYKVGDSASINVTYMSNEDFCEMSRRQSFGFITNKEVSLKDMREKQ